MSSNLGKRKERDDDGEAAAATTTETEAAQDANASGAQGPHGSTLFVSNLPYTATSTDLSTLFSDLAPVRSAFIVTEPGTGVSKGVGYVSFALREDAEAVFEVINKGKEGLELVGRRVRVQWADRKLKDKQKKDPATTKKDPKPPRIPHHPKPPKLPHDPNAIRTLVVSGLPSAIDSKVMWKKIRKYDGAERVEWPVMREGGEEDRGTAHVLFRTPAQASDAIPKLHAHVYKGALLSVTLKKRLETLSKPLPSLSLAPASASAADSAADTKEKTKANPDSKGKAAASAAAAPSHASRLIVRNIPFTASEQDLRAVFLPYGPIYSIHIPLDESGSKSAPSSSASAVKEEDAQAESSTATAHASTHAHPQTKPHTHNPPKNKGFAFIWFLSKKDAEKAIAGCNGTVLRAGVARELVEAKQKRKKMRRLERKVAEAEAVKKGKAVDKEGEGGSEGEGEEEGEGGEGEGEDENMEDEEEEEDKRATERIIAVDWALSKNKWEAEKAKIQEANEDEDVEMQSASESGSGSESDSDGSDSDSEEEDEDKALGVHSGSGDRDEDESDSQPDFSSDEDEDEDEEERDEEPVKPQLPPPETGTTLFIRNIPFNATEDELRTLFRAFGPLRYARITLDPATGRSRGTGFACFWNKEDADRVIAQSELLRAETTGGQAGGAVPKKNPFQLPSILTPDPSSSLAQSLVLHGRTLDVVRAVTRDVAGRLKEENEKAREKADKRNMYLLREGVILPNTPAAAHLTPTEIERRTSSFNARRALLKSNPALYISKTRLSVRQIPTFVTERMLKRLVVHALRAFESEVREGTREGVSADEVGRDGGGGGGVGGDGGNGEGVKAEEADGEEDKKDQKKKPKKKKFHPRDGPIKQTKIVRQPERIDPLTLKGRSKGYGFVELHRHADALRFLRWANNNPAVPALFEEWWKDELEGMIKAERAKPEGKGEREGAGGGGGEGTRDEGRIKRLKEEIARAEDGEGRGKGKKAAKGSLIVEFSIENVQVVQRRNAMQKEAHSRAALGLGAAPAAAVPSAPSPGASQRKRPRKPAKDEQDAHSEEPSPKKRRISGSGAGGAAGTDKPTGKAKSKTQSNSKPEADDSKDKDKEREKGAKPKFANPLGTIIGRKRKERKMGKKGGK